MEIKHKKTLSKSWVVILALAATVAIGGVAAYNIFMNNPTTNKAVSSASFDFDESKAPGWWAGDNINPNVSDGSQTSTSNEPDATRVIAQGTKEAPTGNCFVMYSYWANDSKDPAQVLSETTAPSDPSTQGLFTLKQTNTESLRMNISGSDTPFQLHQYDKSSPDNTGMSNGEEYAIIKAGTGYIKITGVCKTAEELAVTLPVFSAVSFKE